MFDSPLPRITNRNMFASHVVLKNPRWQATGKHIRKGASCLPLEKAPCIQSDGFWGALPGIMAWV